MPEVLTYFLPDIISVTIVPVIRWRCGPGVNNVMIIYGKSYASNDNFKNVFAYRDKIDVCPGSAT